MEKIQFENASKGIQVSYPMFQSMQDNLINGFQAVVRSLVGNIDSNEIVILQGCNITIDGQDFTLNEGYVYYQDEIFQVDAKVFTVIGGETALWSEDNSMIQGVFGDGLSYNFREIRKLTLISGNSGTGIKDYNDITTINGKWLEAPLESGVTGKLLYKRNVGGSTTIRTENLVLGSNANPTVLDFATLPEGFRPSSDLNWIPVVARYSGTVYNYTFLISSSTGKVSIHKAMTNEPGSNQADGDVNINDFSFSTI